VEPRSAADGRSAVRRARVSRFVNVGAALAYGYSVEMPNVHVFEELRRYVRFDARSGEVLRALLPLVSTHFERLAAEFYERIREHEDAHAVLAGEAQILRLRASMVRWLHRIFSGPWDEAYIAQSIAIGQVHIRVGVPPRFVCSAMSVLRVGLTRILEDADLAERERSLAAVHQVLDLELATMIESYCVNFTRRVRSQAEVERATLAASLEATERHYQQAVELAGMIVIGLDAAGVVRLFNPEAERTTGYERDEIEGQPFLTTLVAEEERARVGAMLASTGHGEVHRINFAMTIRSHRTRWLAASVSTGLGGELASIIMAQDVTDSRQLAERSARAEKLAAVGTLAAGLAHEIRNPLNGAHLHLAYLKRQLAKREVDPEVVGAVSVVGDEIQRLSKLVTDFLQFARPRPLERRAVGLSGLVSRVLALVAPAAEGVVLDADLPIADVVVEGDADQIEQLLLNLVRNAVEALHGRARARVVVRLRREPRFAVVDVEDNGPGLPSAEAPIFDAFFTTKPSGTGLGLSIVHRIAQDHGGAIEVRSEPGHTVFTTRFPLAPA
jgi:PAS domain S-box-containing protein